MALIITSVPLHIDEDIECDKAYICITFLHLLIYECMICYVPFIHSISTAITGDFVIYYTEGYAKK